MSKKTFYLAATLLLILGVSRELRGDECWSCITGPQCQTFLACGGATCHINCHIMCLCRTVGACSKCTIAPPGMDRGRTAAGVEMGIIPDSVRGNLDEKQLDKITDPYLREMISLMFSEFVPGPTRGTLSLPPTVRDGTPVVGRQILAYEGSILKSSVPGIYEFAFALVGHDGIAEVSGSIDVEANNLSVSLLDAYGNLLAETGE